MKTNMATDLTRRFGDHVSLICKLLDNYLTNFENMKKKQVTAFQIVHKLKGTFLGVYINEFIE